MALVKQISVTTLTGNTIYLMVKRISDGYYLDDSNGSFAVSPADPYVSTSEDSIMKGLYSKSESRTVWTDGFYDAVAYKQVGGSPAPVSDTIVASGGIQIASDVIIDPT